jgi:hypothetical protein
MRRSSAGRPAGHPSSATTKCRPSRHRVRFRGFERNSSRQPLGCSTRTSRHRARAMSIPRDMPWDASCSAAISTRSSPRMGASC